MPQVYTAPPAPVEPESHAAPVAAAAAVPVASSETPAAAPVAEEKKEEKAEATEPNTLLAASAPSAASAGPVLGAPAVVNTSSTPVVKTTTTTTAPVANDAPASTDISAPVAAEPLNAKIEKVAANANIGEAQPAGQEEGVLNKVAVAGGAALATLGAVVGSAAVAVERATGVDLTHSQPVSSSYYGAVSVLIGRSLSRKPRPRVLT